MHFTGGIIIAPVIGNTKKCPKCGYHNNQLDNYCQECGERFEPPNPLLFLGASLS